MLKNSAIRDLRLIKETTKQNNNPHKKKISGKLDKLANSSEPKRLMKRCAHNSQKFIKWNHFNFQVATESKKATVGKSSSSNLKFLERPKPRKQNSHHNHAIQNKALKPKRSLPAISEKLSRELLLARKNICDTEKTDRLKSVLSPKERNLQNILRTTHKKRSSVGELTQNNNLKVPKLNLRNISQLEDYYYEENYEFSGDSFSGFGPSDDLFAFEGSEIRAEDSPSQNFQHRQIGSLVDFD